MKITKETVQDISDVELRKLNDIIVRELKARRMEKINKVKDHLRIGDPVKCTHPKLCFHENLYIQNIRRSTAIIEDRNDGRGPSNLYTTYKVTMSLLLPVS